MISQVLRTPTFTDCSEKFLCFHVKFEYRVFHKFGQAKFADGGLILGSSQVSLLSKLPLETVLDLKAVKIGSK